MLVANDGDDHDNSDGNNVYFQNHYNDNDVCFSSTATIINKQFSFKFITYSVVTIRRHFKNI